jgi:hypothetical protein
VDPGTAFDWFKNGALAIVAALLAGGFLVPKPTLEDVKAQRDKSQAREADLIVVVTEMKGALQESTHTTKEAVAVMKQVVTRLDGNRQPAKSRPGTSGGG